MMALINRREYQGQCTEERNGYRQVKTTPETELEIEMVSLDGMDEEEREEREGTFWKGFERS